MSAISTSVNQLPQRFCKAISYAKETLMTSSFADHILQIYLYGSCATGKIKYDSDVDILIVVSDKMILNRELIQAFRILRSDLHDIENMAEIDLRLISKTSWEKNDSFYLNNVHREGIQL